MNDIAVKIAAPLTPFNEACNEVSNLIDVAKSAVGNLKTDGNFPKAREDAVQAIEDVTHGLDDRLGGDLKGIYGHFMSEAQRIFQTLPGIDAVTSEGLGRFNAWLPTNSLHQYSYLNVHDFCRACNALGADEDLAKKIDPQSFLYVGRDDMNARAIITRTVLYVQGLVDSGNEDYFFVALAYAATQSDRFRTELANKVREARDAIQSPEVEKAKIDGISDPAVEDKINAMLDMINDYLDVAKNAVTDLKACVDFYTSLSVALGETEVALTEALRLYDEAQATTF